MVGGRTRTVRKISIWRWVEASKLPATVMESLRRSLKTASMAMGAGVGGR